MSMNVKCPGCGKSSEVDPKEIGNKMNCPDCGREFEVANPNLTACPDCFQSVSKRAAVCPYCGAPLGAASGKIGGEDADSGKEQIILKCHPSMKNYMGSVVLGIFSMSVTFLVLLWLFFFGEKLNITGGRMLVALGILAVVFLFGASLHLQVWFKTRFTLYRITNRRIVVTKGLIAKDQNEIWIKDMRGATLFQNAWQRILGLGDISIGTAATAEAEIRLVGIRQPQAVVNQINRLRH